jgi:hypothetical protein
MDSAAAGDSVVVECGTYLTEGVFLKSNVTLTSATGQADCVSLSYRQVSGSPLSPIFARTVQGAAVRGFTFDGDLTNGDIMVWCDTAEVSVSACRFVDWYSENPRIYSVASTIVIEYCEFERNEESAGIGVLWGSTATVRGSVFRDNTGAILCHSDAELTVEDSLFERNRRYAMDGPATVYGGAIQCGARTVIRDCAFSDNTGETGGAVGLSRNGIVEITGCSFRLNSGSEGGGVCIIDGELTMRDCVFEGNEGKQGGALALYGSTASVEDCRMTGNTGQYTGGVHVVDANPVEFRRCTIAENTGWSAGAIAGLRLNATTARLEQCIVWNACGSADVRLAAGTTLSSGCSIVDFSRMIALGTFVDEGGNLDTDPLFCSPFPCGSASVEGDYTLAADSPCLPPNNSCGVRIGALGAGCPATALEATSWADIKSRYRIGR